MHRTAPVALAGLTALAACHAHKAPIADQLHAKAKTLIDYALKHDTQDAAAALDAADRAAYRIDFKRFGDFLAVVEYRDTGDKSKHQPQRLSFSVNLAKTDDVTMTSGKPEDKTAVIYAVSISNWDGAKISQEGVCDSNWSHCDPKPKDYSTPPKGHQWNAALAARKDLAMPRDLANFTDKQVTAEACDNVAGGGSGSFGGGGPVTCFRGDIPNTMVTYYGGDVLEVSSASFWTVAQDDLIVFDGTGIVIHAPYGMGEEVLNRILKEVAEGNRGK